MDPHEKRNVNVKRVGIGGIRRDVRIPHFILIAPSVKIPCLFTKPDEFLIREKLAVRSDFSPLPSRAIRIVIFGKDLSFCIFYLYADGILPDLNLQ